MGLRPRCCSAEPQAGDHAGFRLGPDGPYREKPGFGTLVGYWLPAMKNRADREPVPSPMFLGDMTTGLYGASATMMALWSARMQGGAGQVGGPVAVRADAVDPRSAGRQLPLHRREAAHRELPSTTAPQRLCHVRRKWSASRLDARWRSACLAPSAARRQPRPAHRDRTRPARPCRRGSHGDFIRGKTLAENPPLRRRRRDTGRICDRS